MLRLTNLSIKPDSLHEPGSLSKHNAGGGPRSKGGWLTVAKGVAALSLAGWPAAVLAQQSFTAPTTVTLPPSSTEGSADAGVVAHTYLQIFASSDKFTEAPQVTGPPFAGYLYQTPASIACVYSLQPAAAGCNPNIVSSNPSGGSR